MAQPWAKNFLHGKAWLSCRAGYIQERIRIDGGMCEVCRERPGRMVHHKILLTPENISDPTISLNWDLLSYECKDCHDRHPGHGINHSVLPICEFDFDGNPTQIRPEFERNRL